MTAPQRSPRGGTGVPVPPGRAALPAAPAAGALAEGRAAYAFSARADGTMSTSVGIGDVAGSRASLAARVGLPEDGVAWMHQVHGAGVADATDSTGPAATAVLPACDGIVGTAPGRGVGVLVADCVPVLLHAPGGVAAAHAGRPGVVAGVVPATVDRLRARTGADADAVTALIGPAIGPCCYEVPSGMARDVDAAVPGTAATTTWGTPSVDLVAGVVRQLHQAGVTAIASAGGCTRCDGDGWFSHRASGGAERRPEGRQAGVIALLDDARGVPA